MYRFFLTGSLLLWFAAMSSLFMRDVWPAWTAQDAPAVTPAQIADLEGQVKQYALASDGRRLGTAWSEIRRSSGLITLTGTILLHRTGVMPEIRIESSTDFEEDGDLDSFMLNIYGVPGTLIKVTGERRGIYFPCELQIGPLHRQANLDLSASRLIGDSMRPFSYLPSLKVGQAWRMQLLDPFAIVVRRRAEFTSIIARVVRRETIQHRGRPVACFVVETSPQQIRAWVDDRGQVLVQEVEIPGFGRVQVREEKYQENARTTIRNKIRSTPLEQLD